MQQCLFCDYDLTNFKGQKYRPSSTFYHCPIRGEIRLTEEAALDFEGERFSDNQKKIIRLERLTFNHILVFYLLGASEVDLDIS